MPRGASFRIGFIDVGCSFDGSRGPIACGKGEGRKDHQPNQQGNILTRRNFKSTPTLQGVIAVLGTSRIIELGTLATYLGILLWIGVRSARRIRTSTDYALAGRNVPWVVLLATMIGGGSASRRAED